MNASAMALSYASPREPIDWLIPASRQHGVSSEDRLRLWLARGFWGFGQRTAGRRRFRKGDWVCFYAGKQAEVLAYARTAGVADVPVSAGEWPESTPPDEVVYKLPLTDITWMPAPVRLDAATRAGLDAFAGKDSRTAWGFFVQTTRRLAKADFHRLTGRE